MNLKYFSRVPTENILNFRTLGGYPAGNGEKQMTKHGLIYRSADISHVSDFDKRVIDDLNIKYILDLRSPSEISERPDFCIGDENYVYKNISLLADLNPKELMGNHNLKSRGLMLDFYTALIDMSQKEIKESIDFVANSIGSGSLLFHCSMGRDRTGVLAMLLMGIAGCSKDDIVANFQVTETYLLSVFTDAFPLYTPKQNMLKTITHIEQKFNSIDNYLLKIGVENSQLDKIRGNFVDQVAF